MFADQAPRKAAHARRGRAGRQQFKRVRLPAPGPTREPTAGSTSGSTTAAPARACPPVQFEVAEQGRPVTAELQPYLGAIGHLVAIREDDLRGTSTAPGRVRRLHTSSTRPPATTACSCSSGTAAGSHGRLHGGSPRVRPTPASSSALPTLPHERWGRICASSCARLAGRHGRDALARAARPRP